MDPDEFIYKNLTLLMKDKKRICWIRCIDPPKHLPQHWSISVIVPQHKLRDVHRLPSCVIVPCPEFAYEKSEWGKFLDFLRYNGMVAILEHEFYEFYILPPKEAKRYTDVTVAYKMVRGYRGSNGRVNADNHARRSPFEAQSSAGNRAKSPFESHTSPGNHPVKEERSTERNSVQASFEKNYVRADPSYLQTLGQAHSGWIFGAVAELVDNARDAKANMLKISIEMIYSKQAGKQIPMLSVIDDGHGMTHEDIVRMTCFGHKQTGIDDPDRLGKFGVGFKTGAMRLGRDSLVLTQTENSRSIAFLSQSLNEGKDNLEIPIVSYCRQGQFMEIDTKVQSEDLAKHNLKSIKEFSPFDKYLIGQKTGMFDGKSTGTQIYIWNLDEWGCDYFLHWENGLKGGSGSTFHQSDILIRSKRIRSRPGQIAQTVPLDYSLRAYLEVIFLVPRMKINVQGYVVKSRPLQKSLSKTVVETGNIMGKSVSLTLGFSQLEWEQTNCGIFLYWHGRLIEAYKRVGGMTLNGDVARGVIGVVDVTELMNDGSGRVWVHNNKQGFQDCEAYAELEQWLGRKADEYLDKNRDKLKVTRNSAVRKPDHEWVQCDKCRKWRMLSPDVDPKNLPNLWLCYMNPFNGTCQIPEQKLDYEVITLSTKRFGYGETREKSSQPNDRARDGNANANANGRSRGRTRGRGRGRDRDRTNENERPHKRTRTEFDRTCKNRPCPRYKP